MHAKKPGMKPGSGHERIFRHGATDGEGDFLPMRGTDPPRAI